MSEHTEEQQLPKKRAFTIPQADSSILLHPPFKIEGRPPRITKERVKLYNIRGSFKDNQLFDRYFRPKVINKKIRKIWEWIANQQRSRRSFDGISLTKLSDREYYVYEGVRRISALKHLGWKEIDASIADFTHLRTGRAPYQRQRRLAPVTARPKERSYSSSAFKPVQIFAPKITKPTGIKKDSTDESFE